MLYFETKSKRFFSLNVDKISASTAHTYDHNLTNNKSTERGIFFSFCILHFQRIHILTIKFTLIVHVITKVITCTVVSVVEMVCQKGKRSGKFPWIKDGSWSCEQGSFHILV